MANALQSADRLAAVLGPSLSELGLELYDVELTSAGGTRTLRVLIDRVGGVDLDAISSATEAIGPLLDRDSTVAAVLPGRYLLEVSSPGVERPLRTSAHFRRAVGDEVSLKARDADGAAYRARARLVAADDDGIDIEIEGARRRVGYADIVQARTVFEWGPAPKPATSASR